MPRQPNSPVVANPQQESRHEMSECIVCHDTKFMHDMHIPGFCKTCYAEFAQGWG